MPTRSFDILYNMQTSFHARDLQPNDWSILVTLNYGGDVKHIAARRCIISSLFICVAV